MSDNSKIAILQTLLTQMISEWSIHLKKCTNLYFSGILVMYNIYLFAFFALIQILIFLIFILNLDTLYDIDKPTKDEKLIMQISFLKHNETIAALVKIKRVMCTSCQQKT